MCRCRCLCLCLSITWHWSSSKDRSNHEFGALQGKELHNHLQEMLAHFAVRVVMGRTYVRVRHEGVSKGAFVELVIQHYKNRGGVDMLFIIADDVADEDVFQVQGVGCRVWVSMHHCSDCSSLQVAAAYHGTSLYINMYICLYIYI